MESASQGGAIEATPTLMGEGAPPPHEGEGHESDAAGVSSVAEATEVKACRVSEAEATDEAAAAEVEAHRGHNGGGRSPCVGVSDRGVLNQLVKVNCVPLILNGDAKRHKVYTGLGTWCPTSSLRDRSCIPCIEVLVVGGYKLGERGS